MLEDETSLSTADSALDALEADERGGLVRVVRHEPFGRGTSLDIAQATALSHSGAVRLVDRLVAAHLVERRDGRDGRSLAIVLTASGRSLSRKLTEARARAIESVLENLTAPDRRALLPLADALIATITTQRLESRTTNDNPAWLCECVTSSPAGARAAIVRQRTPRERAAAEPQHPP